MGESSIHSFRGPLLLTELAHTFIHTLLKLLFYVKKKPERSLGMRLVQQHIELLCTMNDTYIFTCNFSLVILACALHTSGVLRHPYLPSVMCRDILRIISQLLTQTVRQAVN